MVNIAFNGDTSIRHLIGVGGFEKVKFAYPKSEYKARVFNTYDEIPEKIEDELIEKLKTMGRKY